MESTVMPSSELDGAQQTQQLVAAAGHTALEVVLEPNGREDAHEFRPGEQVVGVVRVSLEEPTELRGVEVQLQGAGSVQWNERAPGAQGSDQQVSMPVVAQELYLSETQNILGTYPGETQTLSRGTHNFQFRFRLPPTLPSSFSGKYGSVHYDLRARLAAPGGALLCSETINVRQELNAGIYAKFLRPAEIALRRTFAGKGIKSMSTGPIEARFVVNKMGFACGEEIVVNGQVWNKSPMVISGISATLLQHCSYVGANGTRRIRDSRILASANDAVTFTKHDRTNPRVWRNVRLLVPLDAAPSYLEGCSLMEVFYELVFEVRVTEAGKSMSLAVPLVVGLAPVYLNGQGPYGATGLLGRAGPSPMQFRESTYSTVTGSLGPSASAPGSGAESQPYMSARLQ